MVSLKLEDGYGRNPMRVDLFDFQLPPERIALRPVSPRDSARMLVVDPDGVHDRVVRDLPAALKPGDCLVFNDTRVIPAQLEGRRGEARIGVTLHKRLGPRDWQVFMRNAKRVRGTLDLLGSGVTADQLRNCFSDNTVASTAPADLQRLAPCDGEGSGGDWSAGALDLIGLFGQPAKAPPKDQYRKTPVPEDQPNMPHAATAPPRPAVGLPRPVDLDAIGVPAKP